MMTVRDLIEELQKWPLSAVVHVDVSASETSSEVPPEPIYSAEDLREAIHDRFGALGGWEGDRVVRGLSGVRWQSGYHAIALDAQDYNDSERDEYNWIPQEHDTEPLS